MDCIEYKEGILVVGGNTASKEIKDMVLAVATIHNKGIEETCDMINQILQAFQTAKNTLKELRDLIEQTLESVKEVLEDICESCTDRRTRHGRGYIEKSSKYTTKWREKYRPP